MKNQIKKSMLNRAAAPQKNTPETMQGMQLRHEQRLSDLLSEQCLECVHRGLKPVNYMPIVFDMANSMLMAILKTEMQVATKDKEVKKEEKITPFI